MKSSLQKLVHSPLTRRQRGALGCVIIGLLNLNPLSAATQSSNEQSADPTLHAFAATYKLTSSKVPFDGTMTRRIARTQDGNWLAQSQASAMLSEIYQESLFNLNGCSVKPHRFHYQRKVFGKKKHWSATFDWPHQTVRYEPEKGEPASVEIKTDYLADRLSEQFTLRCKVASGETSFDIPSFNKGEISLNHYEVMPGSHTLNTPMGTLQKTVQVTKIHDNPDRSTTLWLWPEKDYLLVQFTQNDEGEKLQISIKALE